MVFSSAVAQSSIVGAQIPFFYHYTNRILELTVQNMVKRDSDKLSDYQLGKQIETLSPTLYILSFFCCQTGFCTTSEYR